MSVTPSFKIESGGLAELKKHIPLLSQYSQFVVISHSHLMQHYGEALRSALSFFNRPILEILIPVGEKAKNLKYVTHCWTQMMAHGVDRSAAILGFGGGVICDLAGFVASCYKRGIDVFYLPTTLLAMVDAAIGGKTAINFLHSKNSVGTFYHPKSILIDTECLNTLPERDFNSGLAEIIKYGMISDPALFEKLENEMEKLKKQNRSLLQEVIERCITIKTTIVSEDWQDKTGRRAILNYGHTFGHAIEAVTHYRRFLHGEAIAIGMSCAATLSGQLSLCHSSLVKRQDELCHRAHLPTQLPRLSIDKLIASMYADKKTTFNKITFILLQKIGQVKQFSAIDPTLLHQLLLKKMK